LIRGLRMKCEDRLARISADGGLDTDVAAFAEGSYAPHLTKSFTVQLLDQDLAKGPQANARTAEPHVKRRILDALTKAAGNEALAANPLGKGRTPSQERLNRHGIGMPPESGVAGATKLDERSRSAQSSDAATGPLVANSSSVKTTANADPHNSSAHGIVAAVREETRAEPSVYLNAWIEGDRRWVPVKETVLLRVSMSHSPELTGQASDAPLPFAATAALYQVTSVDVLVICGTAQVTPIVQSLPLPPDPKAVLEWMLTPQVTGRMSIDILLLVLNEVVHRRSLFVDVVEASRGHEEVPVPS